MRKILSRLALVTVAVAGMTVGVTQSAQAVDNQPCFYSPSPWGNYQCPDWAQAGSEGIPVRADKSPNSPIVGWINPSGPDWYECDSWGEQNRVGDIWNSWWARTTADNGAKGWVSEMYFQGGDNDQTDPGIATCLSVDGH
jgi:hypothetical protein